ncbi:MAG: MFS transporter [Pseudomonadota bacterium]
MTRVPSPRPEQTEQEPGHRKPLLPRGRIWLLLLVSALILCMTLVVVSWRAADLARQELEPEITQKAEIEARALAERVDHALQLDIPPAEIVGFDEVFGQLQGGDPDLVFAAVVRNETVLHSGGFAARDIERLLGAGREGENPSYILTEIPVQNEGRAAQDLGIVVGHDRAALMRPVTDNLFDISVIFFITLALSFELVLLVLTINVALPARVAKRVLLNMRAGKFTLLHGQSSQDEIGRFMARINASIRHGASKLGTRPHHAREVKLIGVRLLAFMFVLAEELARPIMPAFFGQISGNTLDGQLGAGIVMAVQLLMVAIAMPLCSLFQEQVGSLRMYLAGALLATVGLFGTAFATGLWDLLMWRALSGVGYATTFVACQAYVLDATSEKNRTQGTAMMVGGIMLADICGPAIGGILAGHFGQASTFIAGGTMACLAVALAFFLMDDTVRGKASPPVPTREAFRAMLSNRRLQALILFAAVPAKLILSGFLYYLTPVILLDSGATTAETGRVTMLYGLVALLTGWGIARWTDKKQNETRAVGIGGVLTAVGLLLAGWMPEYGMFAIAIAMLGLAQATSIPAQVSASLKISEDFTRDHGTGPVLAVLRLAERLGGALGPLLAAGLTLWVGASGAVLVLGVIAAFAITIFELTIRVPPDRQAAKTKDSGQAS